MKGEFNTECAEDPQRKRRNKKENEFKRKSAKRKGAEKRKERVGKNKSRRKH